MNSKRKLSVGDWVQVRSKEEILRTLDAKGRLDGMVFMPEMFQYCGQKFQVYKRAHKTCDYSTSYPYRTRQLEDTVHLETRCDGRALFPMRCVEDAANQMSLPMLGWPTQTEVRRPTYAKPHTCVMQRSR